MMFEFTESIQIEASADQVWEQLADIEQWWMPSK
jgi:carbon monoxide dehydrogenase subunit G